MTGRLIDLLDPEDLKGSVRTLGWIAGELVGVIVAASALVLLILLAHLG
jgi:hypothetical protein